MFLLFPSGAWEVISEAMMVGPDLLGTTGGTTVIASLNISMAANPSFKGSSTINHLTSS